MSKVDFGRTGVDGLTCPECGAPLQVSLNDVANNATVRCPNGHQISLQANPSGLDRSLTDLNKAFNNLSKKIDIKF